MAENQIYVSTLDISNACDRLADIRRLNNTIHFFYSRKGADNAIEEKAMWARALPKMDKVNELLKEIEESLKY